MAQTFVKGMEFDIILNEPCHIYSNCSMKNPSGKIVKETEKFIYIENKNTQNTGFNSYYGAMDYSGRIKKSEIDFIDYENSIILNQKKNAEADCDIIKVSKSTITDVCAKYCVDERNEIYYLAFETNPEHPISVLWSDLKFVRKNFGVDRHNEYSKITKDSLNYSRSKHIDEMKLALKLNIELNDLEYWNGENFGLIANYNYGKPNPKANHILDFRKQIPRIPKDLSKSKKEMYEADIAKGLYIICKYV